MVCQECVVCDAENLYILGFKMVWCCICGGEAQHGEAPTLFLAASSFCTILGQG